MGELGKDWLRHAEHAPPLPVCVGSTGEEADPRVSCGASADSRQQGQQQQQQQHNPVLGWCARSGQDQPGKVSASTHRRKELHTQLLSPPLSSPSARALVSCNTDPCLCICRSIADALGRKFHRIALGGACPILVAI
jgi:hypothetical protein